jgi:DNA gyrase subunit A
MDQPLAKEKIPVNIEEELKKSYLDYAMSVIVGRALPDVRDGLKPVHRRILYAMYSEGLLSDKKYSKCAGVVGEVLKKYHPHGDSAVYDALVRMAQDFNMRYPLIDGQGNFGSIDGDPPAAYRYTEARLTKLAEEMLADIEKETVDFTPNFDNTTEEPLVLPSKIPNLIINGSSGIAVGMATNIPPHNLNETIDALTHLIKKPNATIDELIKIMPAPDFPTGGYIYGIEGIKEAYTKGKGIIQLRAKAVIERKKGERVSIVVTEIPYQVNKAKLIEKIAELVRDKKIEGISEIRDESNREGIRIVLDLKRDEEPEIILNKLYKFTQMQESFGIIMLALVKGQPKVLDLKSLLVEFIDFRKEVVIRRTSYLLKKAEERAHILEGLKIAVENIDAVISLIRKSKTPEEARIGLMKRFKLTEIQAQAILDMKLQRLTSLEMEKIIEEHKEVMALIKKLKAILGSEKEIMNIIVEELKEIKEKYGDERRTQIITETKDFSIEDLIKEEDMVVTITREGYIKRNPISLYRAQRRGGKGKTAMGTKDEDIVESLFVASTHSYILFFTDDGRAYWLKVHEIPKAGRTAKGKPIVNLINIQKDEKITAYLPVRNFEEGKFIVMLTRNGTIKKTDLMAFSNPRSTGIIAINLDKGDRLVSAKLTNGNNDILISTKDGISIRFNEEDVRSMGRTATGVRGINLEKGDEVIGMDVIEEKTFILTASENGFGKRTPIDDFRIQSRGGKGVICMKVTEKTGKVIGVLQVREEDEVMLITTKGTMIRLKVKDIRIISRNTQGVKLIDVEPGEKVASICLIMEKEEEENGEVVEEQNNQPPEQ